MAVELNHEWWVLLMIPGVVNRGVRTRARASEVFRTVWRYGDPWARVFLALLVVGVGFVLILSMWVVIGMLQDKLSFEASLAYAVAVTSAVFFLGAWNEPMFTAPVVDEYTRRGWWRPESVPYYIERTRYLSAWGREGRFHGTVGWGLSAWLVYLTLISSAVPFIGSFAALAPSNRFLVSFAVTLFVSIGFSVSFGIRNRRLHLEADARGYRLASLYPGRRKQATTDQR